MSENYFVELNSVNVNEHTERKNGLTYLSWTWAWGETKKRFPDANYKVYEDENGCIYWTDGRTAWVKTGVTVNGIEHIEYLPVKNYKNKSIPLSDITSFDINTAIKRSLTKAIALHGLGLYIYAGEDIPQEEEMSEAKAAKAEEEETPEEEVAKAEEEETPEEEVAKAEEEEKEKRSYIATINELLTETESDGAKVLKYVNGKFNTEAQAFDDLTINQLAFAAMKLDKKRAKNEHGDKL